MYQNDLSDGQAISDTQYVSYWEKFIQHNLLLTAACDMNIPIGHFEPDVKSALMNIGSIERIRTAYYVLELNLLLCYLHTSSTQWPVEACGALHIALEILCPIPGDQIDAGEQVRMVRSAFAVIIGTTDDPKLREMPLKITLALIKIARSFGHATAIQEAARLMEVYAQIACPLGEDQGAFASKFAFSRSEKCAQQVQ